MDTIDPLYGVRQLQKLQNAFEVRRGGDSPGSPAAARSGRQRGPERSLAGRCGQDADEDGSGELEMKEFLEKLGPLIGSEENMSMKEVGKLFMKIDADSNGGVDWCVGGPAQHAAGKLRQLRVR